MMLTGEREILDVIYRTHECADTYAISSLLVRGLIFESEGQLYLTGAGHRKRMGR